MSQATSANNKLADKFEEFYHRYYGQDGIRDERILELARDYPNDQSSLVINWRDLFQFNAALADDLLENAETSLEAAEDALRQYDLPVDLGNWEPSVQVVEIGDAYKRDIGAFGVDDRDTLRVITGQISQKTTTRPKAGGVVGFTCQRCGVLNEVPQPDQAGEVQWPYQCESCERQGPFTMDADATDVQLHQTVRVQTPPEKAEDSGTASVDIHLHDDLVNAAEVGERVNVVTHVRMSDGDDDSPLFEWDFEAVGIERLETDWEELNVEEHLDTIKEVANSDDYVERIVDSFMPRHHGDRHVKLALMLQMLGGLRKHIGDGDPTRGDINMLLIGDPSTGKTQFSSFACELSPRSVYTSGKSSSAAGLTAACVRDDFGEGNGFTIKGGVMVSAHKGVAGIDELDKMDEEDQTSLMEAMSRQTVSVSKAGINATLPAQARVLASANPIQGRFDPYSPVSEQFDFHDALMSRFDLVFTFVDQPDKDQDKAKTEHVLRQQQLAGKQKSGHELTDEEKEELESGLSLEALRAYIAYAREEVEPWLTDEARDRLQEFYLEIRDDVGADEDRVPITLRKLQALVRLSEAAARMRLAERVEEQDAELAIRVARASMEDISKDPESGEYDADIVETGRSRSQAQRVADIKETIRDFENDEEYTHGAPIEEVLGLLMAEHDYSRSKLESDIQNLRDKGEAYTCNNGECLRMVKN